MITIQSNITDVLSNIKSMLQQKYLPADDKIARVVATSLVGVVHDRIHVQGLDAKGQKIGTYSNEYMKVRESSKYNRTSDKDVILSLTRQMENDFDVVAGSGGSYGLGFKNPINFDKSQYMEEKYNVTIYGLTPDEQKLVPEIIETEIQNQK